MASEPGEGQHPEEVPEPDAGTGFMAKLWQVGKNLLQIEDRLTGLLTRTRTLAERQQAIDNALFEVKGDLKQYPNLLDAKLQRAVVEIEKNYLERLVKLEQRVEQLERRVDPKTEDPEV